MGKFEIGLEVKLVKDTEIFIDEDHSGTVVLKAGTLGVIVGDDYRDEGPGPYEVKWDARYVCQHFHQDIAPITELAPTGTEPAAGDEGGAGFTLFNRYKDEQKAADGKFPTYEKWLEAYAIALHNELLTERAAHTVNAQRMNEFEAENAQLERDLAAARERVTAVEAALEPFAEAWLQVPYGVVSPLRIYRFVDGIEVGTESLGIGTDTLQDAHTAYFKLPAPETKEGGVS